MNDPPKMVYRSTDRIYFCGDNAAIAISSETYINFAISGADIYGSIEYLRDSTGQITAVPDWCYYKLFADCRGIYKAPELPATEIGASAYRCMFINCEYLTDAPPTLPALTLSEYCYGEMFSNCHRMVKAPEMMAETLARYSCAAMFIDCSYLREITVHFAALNDPPKMCGFQTGGVFRRFQAERKTPHDRAWTH